MYMHYWGGGYGYGAPEWWSFAPLIIGPIIGFIAILVLWELFWKGLALWHAARRGEPLWFLAILVFNTAGILPVVYLFFFAKLRWGDLFTLREVHRRQ